VRLKVAVKNEEIGVSTAIEMAKWPSDRGRND
jgi:hypothetical protein